MIKSVGRKGVALWCFGWQVEERIKSDSAERRRSREAVGGRQVSKTDGRRIRNGEEEAGNSEEELWDKKRDYTWREI